VTFLELKNKVVADLDGKCSCIVDVRFASYQPSSGEKLSFHLSAVKTCGGVEIVVGPTPELAYERFRAVILPFVFGDKEPQETIDERIESTLSDLAQMDADKPAT